MIVRGWATDSTYTDSTTTDSISWLTGNSHPVWYVAEEPEEPAKPKFKAPRPERKSNRVDVVVMELPRKQTVKQMFSSQRWNR